MTYFDELICSGNSFPTQPKGHMNFGNGNLYGEILIQQFQQQNQK